MTQMFSKAPPPPPPAPSAATITPPPTMPDPFSPSAMEAKRQAIAATNVGGRQSTILTTAASRAGGTLAGSTGGTYSAAKTGTA